MNEIAQRLAVVAEKVKEIIRANELLKQENARLQEQLDFMQADMDKLSAGVHARKDEFIALSTAKPVYIGDDREAARKKIDDLVREIDDCLTILNSQ